MSGNPVAPIGNPLAPIGLPIGANDFQTGASAFTSIQNYTGCCISPYSFVPINIYSASLLIIKFRVTVTDTF